jgi:ubiquinone/menaquinone biosynthesis C-methylase UbiE
MDPAEPDLWAGGAAYEGYIGRWSRPVARAFLAWLGLPPGAGWLDVGCGTGALSQVILETARPRLVHGVDFSRQYLAFARGQLKDRLGLFCASAVALGLQVGAYDAVVSGLALNFFPDPAAALGEMARAARPGAVVAAYVWDYAADMQLIRFFWDAAAALDPRAVEADEGRRFPLCQPAALRQLFEAAGLAEVTLQKIVIPTAFANFDDYWVPFLSGQGPAPGYVRTLGETERVQLRQRLRAVLPTQPDGAIALTAGAWAVRGQTPA